MKQPTLEFDSLPNGRKVLWASSDRLSVAVARGGGHIAALRLPGLAPHINPFWQPPWPSHEPEAVTDSMAEAEYGGPPEGRLLASILGQNLALGLYGPPSAEELAAGEVTHGKVNVQPWDWERKDASTLVGECVDDFFQLRFSRQVCARGACLEIEEQVQNLSEKEMKIPWQQHVTFGPPFIEEGFWAAANCDLGATHPQSFGAGASLVPGIDTQWPFAPQHDGGQRNYRRPLTRGELANDFAAYRMRPSDTFGYFVAGNTRMNVNVFYIWPREFFPWLGIWDQKNTRTLKPWEGRTSARAFEFGSTPFPRSRSDLLAQPRMFDVSTLITLPAAGMLWVRYILGVFQGTTKGTSSRLADENTVLEFDDRELEQIFLPHGWCACSTRKDLE